MQCIHLIAFVYSANAKQTNRVQQETIGSGAESRGAFHE
jgi:hypothetical protein